MEVDTRAIDNIRLLGNLPNDITELNLMVEGNVIKRLTDPSDDYDSLFSLKDLSYPVLWSFYKTFKLVESVQWVQKREFMCLMDHSLDNLNHLINQMGDDGTDEWISFKDMIDDLEDSYSELYERFMGRSCYKKIRDLFETYFDRNLVSILENSQKYLYLTPMDNLDDDTSDSEEDVRDGMETESESSESSSLSDSESDKEN